MKPEAWPRVVLTLLVVVAIGAGLWMVGGPRAARIEKRDRARFDDLERLVPYVKCVARRNDKKLPDRLEVVASCDQTNLHLADPFTGASYHYEKVDENTFRLCAEFERSKTLSIPVGAMHRLNRETGCIEESYYPPRSQ